jgi:hypothetical protein
MPSTIINVSWRAMIAAYDPGSRRCTPSAYFFSTFFNIFSARFSLVGTATLAASTLPKHEHS